MPNTSTSKPKMSRAELIGLIQAAHPGVKLPEFFICGIRGYYKKTMGNPLKNDRAIYDDAIFLVGPGSYFAFNANTDPSAFRPGIANLKAGIWKVYKFDKHKGKYLALCQRAGAVTVVRDGSGDDTGWFGINIHKGGYNTTSSLGCQTIHPDQWEEFIGKAEEIAEAVNGDNYKDDTYEYILLDI